MNKTELIHKLSGRLNITQNECGHYLNNLLDILGDELESGNGLVLQGFGTFTRWQQTARLGRNPRTGENALILPRTRVKFNPGKMLLTKLNKKKGAWRHAPFPATPGRFPGFVPLRGRRWLRNKKPSADG